MTFVRNKLKLSNKLGRIAEDLCDMAIDARSGDNCCVIIVMLKQPSFADEEDMGAGEERKKEGLSGRDDMSSDGTVQAESRKSLASLHATT